MPEGDCCIFWHVEYWKRGPVRSCITLGSAFLVETFNLFSLRLCHLVFLLHLKEKTTFNCFLCIFHFSKFGIWILKKRQKQISSQEQEVVRSLEWPNKFQKLNQSAATSEYFTIPPPRYVWWRFSSDQALDVNVRADDSQLALRRLWLPRRRFWKMWRTGMLVSIANTQ